MLSAPNHWRFETMRTISEKLIVLTCFTGNWCCDSNGDLNRGSNHKSSDVKVRFEPFLTVCEILFGLRDLKSLAICDLRFGALSEPHGIVNVVNTPLVPRKRCRQSQPYLGNHLEMQL